MVEGVKVNTEELYKQMVINELKYLVTEAKPIRLSFAPGTETHSHISMMAAANSTTERAIVESAIRVFFVAWMRSKQNV